MGQEASLRLWLVGRVSRLAGRVAEVLPAGVQVQLGAQLSEVLQASGDGDLLLVDLQSLLRHSHAERAAWVRSGLLHSGKLLLLDEERLVYHPSEDMHGPRVAGFDQEDALLTLTTARRSGGRFNPLGSRVADVSAALQGIFNKRTASNRHQAVFHRWQQCMTETAVLDCQRWLKLLPLTETAVPVALLHRELHRQQHLLQSTQLHFRQLLQFMSERKVVSWEARSLLDTANALLMVCNVVEPDELGAGQELTEYGQIIHETMLRFQQQLTAALFCYQEQLAFHWFFTDQRLQRVVD